MTRARFLLATALVLTAGSTMSLGQQAPRMSGGAATAPAVHDLDAFYKALPSVKTAVFDETLALSLSAMPLSCLDRPHARPSGRGYLWEPTYSPPDDFQRTRAFYGCVDWHSAVNSTWALVKSLQTFPASTTAPLIRAKLDRHLGKTNIEGEVAYFKEAGAFEMPYGYAWTLKLQGELLRWKDPDAAKWAANLQPLVTLFSTRLTDYFTQLERPVRTGVHPNTALAMHLLFDYLDDAGDQTLKTALLESAQRFFGADEKCATATEPGPSDFLSPCLTEAALMARILPRPAFVAWLDKFLVPLPSPEFKPLTEPIDPSLITRPERIAAKSHLIGLAFLRAETMNRIASALPPGDKRIPALRRLSAMHAAQGMDAMHVAGYAGSHYLGAFSILYLLSNGPS